MEEWGEAGLDKGEVCGGRWEVVVGKEMNIL